MKELVLIGIAYFLLSKKTGVSIFGVPANTGMVDQVKFDWSWNPKNPLLDEGWDWSVDDPMPWDKG